MTDVLIHSPFLRQTSQGNSVSADRLEDILLDQGLRVAQEEVDYQGGEALCFIALNARRSAGAVVSFKAAHPGSPVIVILTGTDINHAEMEDPASPTRRTMDAVDALVVLHDAELESVPEYLRDKCYVIYPSVRLPPQCQHQLDQPDQSGRLNVIMAGNLRSEKNPQLVIDACGYLHQHPDILISSYGEASGQMAQNMLGASSELMNFDWHGKIDHAALLQKMEHAHLLLNTSTQEGGANAICEAITVGLPVVASKIRGNIGMLGEDYLGFFPSGDARALAKLLQRSVTDKVFYSTLKSQLADRTPLFTYAAESKAWHALVSELLPR